jgi:sugar phosphate isomerase/epimerase
LTEKVGSLEQPAPDHPFAQLTSRLYINAPFARLRQDLLRVFLDNRLQPEIGLEGSCLYENSAEDFRRVARVFKDAGLACTIHAPFGDLAPGATDAGVLAASRAKLGKAFDLIAIFEPRAIVCHLGFEANKHARQQAEWLANSLETWRQLLPIAAGQGVVVAFENTYETNPEQHRRVLTALDSPAARFCLDVGHVMAFAKNTWQDWLPALAPWLTQLHLHDNTGAGDDHLAVGAGRFDFSGLFSYLRTQQLRPLITLEPHQEEGLWASLQALELFELPEPPTIVTT